MSIATEITRLQGIKTDIRASLVSQGITEASTHNMSNFSADILAIQGGEKGVYITVTCNSAYVGYDIILSSNDIEIDRKQCPSSCEVTLFAGEDEISGLPATFTISNSLNRITESVTASLYGWYETELELRLFLYNVGNQCTDTTGGWLDYRPTTSGYSKGSVVYGNESITTNTKDTYSNGLRTINKVTIDGTKYSRLVLVLNQPISYETTLRRIAISTNILTDLNNNYYSGATKSVQLNTLNQLKFEMNISDINGDYYVTIADWTWTSGTSVLKISQIYLE